MKKFIIILLAMLIVFVACNNKTHPKKLARIDSLNTVIDSARKNLSRIDTLNIKEVYKEYKEQLGLIGRYFDDKKDDSTWSTMTAFGYISKPLKNFIKDYPGLYKEIKFSFGQLDSLKMDIQGNKIAIEKIDEYIKTEADAVNTLKTQIDMYVNGASKNLKLYDSLKPRVKRVIERLRKENKLSSPGKDSEKNMEDD